MYRDHEGNVQEFNDDQAQLPEDDDLAETKIDDEVTDEQVENFKEDQDDEIADTQEGISEAHRHNTDTDLSNEEELGVAPVGEVIEDIEMDKTDASQEASYKEDL